ncbi:hypothetical protein RD110_02485 [Rhodoferax koreense]|uniref:Transmembrane protein n=1 Tax=Rhodoferax koreensis TaxID=1842727 RepID=A0A1P8K336_9BURK|nr:hypothetical protein RD110_02485 [Rhodoferax koreense]
MKAAEPVGTASAVSWGAILAGAAAAAALSMILLILGLGLGLSSVSPWSQSGIGAAALGFSTIVWVTVTQLLASGMGGYLAGRLRSRWAGVHTDEVYFRDTAHGFLSWAIASLVTAAVIGSAIGSIVGSGVQAGASIAGGAAATVATAGVGAAAAGAKETADANGGPSAYFIDSLFRRDMSTPAAASAPAAGAATEAGYSAPAPSTAEVSRILMRSVATGVLPPEDVRYVGQLVAQRTGLSQADAEKRVADTYARMQAQLKEAQDKAKEAADKARKASTYGALWLFVSLLAGAFFASFMATFGGRQRDL